MTARPLEQSGFPDTHFRAEMGGLGKPVFPVPGLMRGSLVPMRYHARCRLPGKLARLLNYGAAVRCSKSGRAASCMDVILQRESGLEYVF